MRSWVLVAVTLALGLAFAGAGCRCSGSPGPGDAAPGEPVVLTLYSGRTEPLVQPVIEAFEKESGVRVRVSYADTAQLVATLLEEGPRTPADVYFAQDAATMGLLEQGDHLAELPQGVLDRVDRRFRSVKGVWVGTSARVRVVAYNPKRVPREDLPRSIKDLTDPKYRKRLGWAPGNASFQAFVGAMIQLEGKEATRAWLTGVQANAPRSYPSNTPLVLAVGSGEIDLALTNHYYAHRIKAERGADFPVENHYLGAGDAGALVNISAAAVLAQSKKREAAVKLVAFLLSETAQSHFAKENFELPVAAGVKPAAALPSLAELSTPPVDLTQLQGLETAAELIQSSGVAP